MIAGERFAITVVDECAPGCGGSSVGPCTVTLDTHPAIPVVNVIATRTYAVVTDDGACLEVCGRQEHECLSPELFPGVYELRVNGVPFEDIEVTPDAPSDELECFRRGLARC